MRSAGSLIETHGFVAAGDLTRALVAAARAHGAQVARAEPRAAHHHARTARSSSRPIADRCSGDAVVFARRQLGGADRDRWRQPRRCRCGRCAGQLLWLGWIGHAAAARHLEQPLLPRAVGRWDAAGRGDGGGGRLRRARDGGGRSRSARRGVRDRAARLVGGVPRRARRAAAGVERRPADHRSVVGRCRT